MLAQELKQDIEANQLKPLYILVGSSGMTARVLRQLGPVQRYTTAAAAIARLSAAALFSRPNVAVVVRDADVLAVAAQRLVRAVRAGTLILVYDKLDERTTLATTGAPYRVILDDPEDGAVAAYVAKQTGIAVHTAVQWVQQYGSDLMMWEKICRQLAQSPVCDPRYFIADLTMQDLILAVSNAVLGRDSASMWGLYAQLSSTDSFALLTILYTNFRNLLVMAEYVSMSSARDISEKTGLPWYAVSRLLPHAALYSIPQLGAIVRKIQQADVLIKSGQQDATVLLDELLLYLDSIGR